jgi:hypothetical protein
LPANNIIILLGSFYFLGSAVRKSQKEYIRTGRKGKGKRTKKKNERKREKTNKNPWISKLERNKNLTNRKKTVGVVKKVEQYVRKR